MHFNEHFAQYWLFGRDSYQYISQSEQNQENRNQNKQLQLQSVEPTQRILQYLSPDMSYNPYSTIAHNILSRSRLAGEAAALRAAELAALRSKLQGDVAADNALRRSRLQAEFAASRAATEAALRRSWVAAEVQAKKIQAEHIHKPASVNPTNQVEPISDHILSDHIPNDHILRRSRVESQIATESVLRRSRIEAEIQACRKRRQYYHHNR